jgi:CRISPR system Cascade subunit CasA
LLHPRHPFYQTAGFTAKSPSGVNRLGHEHARGNNATLFDHTADDRAAPLPLAAAARLLIAEQAYALGGGKSDLGNVTSAPLAVGACVLPQGANLFETLMLNLVRVTDDAPVPRLPDDAPAWERDEAPTQGPPYPRGYLDLLTWQSRTLRLHLTAGESPPRVAQVSYAQGRRYAPAGLVFEPAFAYRKAKEEGFRPLRFTEDRALWRDRAALFRFAGQGEDRGPGNLAFLADLAARGDLDPHHRCDLAVLGLCSDQAKISFWRQERLPLPAAYLTDPEVVARLARALELAEAVARGLWAAAREAAGWALAPADGQADGRRAAALVNSLAPERLFWSRLEIPFQRFFRDLAEAAPGERDGVVTAWARDTLARQARAAFEQTAGRLDRSARLLRAATRGRERLARELARALPADRPAPVSPTTEVSP